MQRGPIVTRRGADGQLITYWLGVGDSHYHLKNNALWQGIQKLSPHYYTAQLLAL
jgi:hypothetical protein